MGLSQLGVSAEQEAVYRALITGPRASVAELVDGLGLSTDGVREAITALLRLDLVAPATDALSGVQVRRPGIALPALAVRHAQDLAQRLSGIVQTQAEIKALDDLIEDERVGEAAGADVVEVLTGRAAVQNRLDVLAQTSRRSLDTVTPGPSLPFDALREPMLMRSLHRGMRVRWIVRPHVLVDRGERDVVTQAIRGGVEMRVTTEKVERLVIVDARSGLVPREAGNLAAGALLVHHPPLLAALQASFDRLWERAAPLRVVAGRLVDPDLLTLDEHDRHLLDALAVHVTDEAAARALSVSERQLRRRIARAFTVLGARNRFDAGALAQRHGLLGEAAAPPGHRRSAAGGRPEPASSA